MAILITIQAELQRKGVSGFDIKAQKGGNIKGLVLQYEHKNLSPDPSREQHRRASNTKDDLSKKSLKNTGSIFKI